MQDNWSKMLCEEKLNEAFSMRKREYVEIKIDREDIPEYEENGWEIKKVYKNGSALISKTKIGLELLKDKLWTIFYKMGFSVMSGYDGVDVKIETSYYSGTKHIDIVAIDDETCLFIDCYFEDYLDRTKVFTEKIQNISITTRALASEIKNLYGERKCKYIVATNNIIISAKDMEDFSKAKISVFDDESIEYYQALVDHLGTAARYQLLGNLFSKTIIKGMDERVPAIEGKMGNLTYYSFLIEPERLLKIGYVLHRNKANHDQMPTYQRLIKKERLKSIREYVNNGGFFPNSLIISIDSKDGKLRFEKAQQELQGAHSRVGTLFLPKEYQTAYIIDGQHRLYGYSDSKFANKDTLPVIAFVDLDKDKQVKMFMDINENQKPVSKTLRNILNIDLNWNSENLMKRREAVILNVAQNLGENTNSPLYGRIITGEDSVTETRCITIEYIKSAIEKTELFNKYNKKNEIIEKGLLDKVDSDETSKIVYSYIRNCIQVIADVCKDEWEKGSKGYLTINNTMVGIIRVIGDITKLIAKKINYDINSYDIEELYQACGDMIYEFADVLNSLSLEKRNNIKSAKGGAAKDYSWRTLQVALHETNSDFTSNDLLKYIEENCVNYNEEALNELLELREQIIYLVKEKMVEKFDWENIYFPEDLSIKLNQKIAAQNIKNKRAGIENDISIWDVLELDDICKIFGYKSNWSTLFKESFVEDGVAKSKLDVISSIKSIMSSENKINNGKQITKTEFEQIDSFYSLLVGRK